MKFTHVKFMYFKDSGKYYTEGEHNFDGEVPFFEAIQKCKQMLDDGIRPGLVDGKEFHCLITVYTEYGPLPWLYIRSK